MRRRIAREDA
jgi:basic membrane protein A